MKKLIIRILLAIIMMIPILFILLISKKEIQKYQAIDSIIIENRAYGSGWEIKTSTLYESVTLSGTIDSDSYELIHVESGADIYYLFKVGDLVYPGKTLLLKDGKEIKATFSGVINNVEPTNNGLNIVFKTTDNLVFLTNNKTNIELTENEIYETDQGEKFKLVSNSKINIDGNVVLVFEILNGSYAINDAIAITIFTNHIYENVLTVPKDCIYNMEINQPTIRLISSEGQVLEERVVDIFAQSSNEYAVNGVNHGDLCDIEYGRFINSKIEP